MTASLYASPMYKLIDLGLQESDQSEALAVNDEGQIVGDFELLGEKHYFLFDEKNGIMLIDLPKTATVIVLNNAGQIAGNYLASTGVERGFIWDKLNGFTDL